MSDESREFLERLSAVVDQVTGLHYPGEKLGDLERAINRLAAEKGASGDETARLLLAPRNLAETREQIESFARYLTVGETYFFREPESLKAFAENILPELLAKNAHTRKLSIWSAGCCTGEEAYSLAIILHRLLPAGWQLRLLASDINADYLERARAGVYGEWSFRAMKGVFTREREHFSLCDGRYHISEDIKKMVRFEKLNLALDEVEGEPFDFISCRNVLIYFSTNQMDRVHHLLSSALAEGGYLSLTATEAGCEPGSSLIKKIVGGSYFFQRGLSQDLKEKSELSLSATPALNRVQRLLALGDHLTASSELAPLLNSGSAVAYFFHAVILQEDNRTLASRAALERCLELEREMHVARLLLAAQLLTTGEQEAARHHLRLLHDTLSRLPGGEIIEWSEGASASDLLLIADTLLDDAT